jgi:hypothetical protein
MRFGGSMKRLGLLAGTVVALAAGTAAASAQFFPGYGYGPRVFYRGYAGPVVGFAPGPYFAPRPYAPPAYVTEEYLHPRQISAILGRQGFRNIDVLSRRGDVFVVNAQSPRTGATRLIVDAYEGEIIERFAMAGDPPRQTSPRAPAPPRVSVPNAPQPRTEQGTDSGGTMPLPPRRPTAAVPASPTPALTPTPAPAATTPPPLVRRPSDWSPINSVPPAALE